MLIYLKLRVTSRNIELFISGSSSAFCICVDQPKTTLNPEEREGIKSSTLGGGLKSLFLIACKEKKQQDGFAVPPHGAWNHLKFQWRVDVAVPVKENLRENVAMCHVRARPFWTSPQVNSLKRELCLYELTQLSCETRGLICILPTFSGYSPLHASCKWWDWFQRDS